MKQSAVIAAGINVPPGYLAPEFRKAKRHAGVAAQTAPGSWSERLLGSGKRLTAKPSDPLKCLASDLAYIEASLSHTHTHLPAPTHLSGVWF